MRRLLGKLRRPRHRPAAEAPPPTVLAPDTPLVVIGDIHGCCDLLLQLERLILQRVPGLPAVLVGDYIDRGEQSRDVLEMLVETTEDGPQPVTCLMGNHEEMCLNFLDDPVAEGGRWLRFGGLQTLASFGISAPATAGDPDSMRSVRDRLADAMGAQMITWLRSRPLSVRNGNVWVCHAGVDPALGLEAQPRETLLWGHRGFARGGAPEGVWVAHGHTIVERASARAGQIAVDTGAYATGRLTAAVISPGKVDFISTGGRR